MFWVRSQDYKEFKKITIIAEDIREALDKADKRAKRVQSTLCIMWFTAAFIPSPTFQPFNKLLNPLDD